MKWKNIGVKQAIERRVEVYWQEIVVKRAEEGGEEERERETLAQLIEDRSKV